MESIREETPFESDSNLPSYLEDREPQLPTGVCDACTIGSSSNAL